MEIKKNMYDITWQFGNFFLGIFGAFSIFIGVFFGVWIGVVFGRRIWLYWNEERMPTFADAFQILIAGFVLAAIGIANSNAPKFKIDVPTRAVERVQTQDKPIINLAPDIVTPTEREAEQRALDTETNNRTINK